MSANPLYGDLHMTRISRRRIFSAVSALLGAMVALLSTSLGAASIASIDEHLRQWGFVYDGPDPDLPDTFRYRKSVFDNRYGVFVTLGGQSDELFYARITEKRPRLVVDDTNLSEASLDILAQAYNVISHILGVPRDVPEQRLTTVFARLMKQLPPISTSAEVVADGVGGATRLWTVRIQSQLDGSDPNRVLTDYELIVLPMLASDMPTWCDGIAEAALLDEPPSRIVERLGGALEPVMSNSTSLRNTVKDELGFAVQEGDAFFDHKQSGTVWLVRKQKIIAVLVPFVDAPSNGLSRDLLLRMFIPRGAVNKAEWRSERALLNNSGLAPEIQAYRFRLVTPCWVGVTLDVFAIGSGDNVPPSDGVFVITSGDQFLLPSPLMPAYLVIGTRQPRPVR